MVNIAQLIGNVGKEPEIKSFDNGGKIANFTLATSEKYKNKAGEMIDATEWHNIQVSGKLVDVVEKYIKKGDKIYLQGSIHTRSWDDKDGNKKYMTEIRVKEIRMLGGKSSTPTEGTAEVAF